MTVLDDSRHAGRRGILESCCYLWGLGVYFDAMYGGREFEDVQGWSDERASGKDGSGV